MMFFAHACRILAYVGLAFSAFILLVAAKLLWTESAPELVTQANRDLRYGVEVLFWSLILGLLAEIGLALRKK